MKERICIVKFKVFCLMFAPIVLFGVQCVQLPALPFGELPNSEVVTNVALNVDYADWVKHFA